MKFKEIFDYLCSVDYAIFSLMLAFVLIAFLIRGLEKDVENLNCKLDQLSGYYLGFRDKMDELPCVRQYQEELETDKREENEKDGVEDDGRTKEK